MVSNPELIVTTARKARKQRVCWRLGYSLYYDCVIVTGLIVHVVVNFLGVINSVLIFTMFQNKPL